MVTGALNERQLESRLAAIEAASTWSPRVVSKLENLIRGDDERALFRVNPVKFAADRGIDEEEAIALFLHAAKAGLFEMEWDIVCASCGNVFKSFRNLEKVDPHFRCNLCSMDNSSSLDDYIHIVFTISPQVRGIALHDPERLGVEQLLFDLQYSQDVRAQYDGLTLPELMKSWTPELTYLQPGESVSLYIEIEGSGIMCRDVTGSSSIGFFQSDGAPPLPNPVRITITESGFEAADLDFQEFEFDLPLGSGIGNFLFPRVHYFSAGPLSLECVNETDRRKTFWAIQYPQLGSIEVQKIEFNPFLSARRLLSNATFHRLFRGEIPPESEGLSVNDLTFLFTDLEDSTAMYDQIGDATAYNLVRLHFDVLNEAVASNSGAVIKTIGDAIMATFLDPVNAVSAALGMFRGLAVFNADMSAGLNLNVGIHRGHSIAVRLNNRLDYFGQNVNIAARTQQLSTHGQILITQDVFDAPGVGDLLAGHAVVPVEATMKGVGEVIRVFQVTSPAQVAS